MIHPLGLTLPVVPQGRLLALATETLPDFAGHFALAEPPLPALRAGEILSADGVELLQVQGVGHWPHLEAPDAFDQALLEFLRETPPVRVH